MAITTQDGLVAGLGSGQRLVQIKANVTAVSGRMTALWSGAGQPGVGSVTLGQAATGAVPVDSDTGYMPFTNPGSGNTYLAGVSGMSTVSGMVVIWDNTWVWGSGGSGWVVTTTGAQSTSSPTAQTRPDANGTNTELWLHVLATLGVGAATPSIGYTNSAGTGTRSTGAIASTSSYIIGSMIPFPLQAGDAGVKQVDNITLTTTMTSGTAAIRIMRRVATLPVIANVGFKFDAFDLGMPLISNDAALMVGVQAASTTSGPLQMELILAQG